MDTVANADGDFTMPVFKKSRTTRSSKVSKQSMPAEGRENIPLLSSVVPGGGREIFAQSISRRKSPRLN